MVYFILAEELKRIKIGFTKDNNINQRLSGIRTSCPVKLKLLAIIPRVTCITEKYLHQKFKKYHITGEWFNLSDEIIEFLLKLKEENLKEGSIYIPQIKMLAQEKGYKHAYKEELRYFHTILGKFLLSKTE